MGMAVLSSSVCAWDGVAAKSNGAALQHLIMEASHTF